MKPFAAAIAAVAYASPMRWEPDPERVLVVDGDGLAYYCAGGKDTDPAEAKHFLLDKVESARRHVGAGRVVIALTGMGNDKGKRYAIARVKPYQGQRGGEKPKNWDYLRRVMELGQLPDVECVIAVAEADDYAAWVAAEATNWQKVAFLSQDKDWRMIPGLHIDWDTHAGTRLAPGKYQMMSGDKLFGRKFFWSQMLMGDTADHIPGLPWYVDDVGKKYRIGEVTTAQVLAHTTNESEAFEEVRCLYTSFYGEEWLLQMMEQACLLWLRTGPSADVMNVCAEGNPMENVWNEHRDRLTGVIAELGSRIAAVPREVDGEDSADRSGDDVAQPAQDVQALSASSFLREGSDGSRSLDWPVPRSFAQQLQCPVGEDRERSEAVRSDEPLGVLAWGGYLLASRAPAAVHLPDTQDGRRQAAASQQARA